MSRIVESLYEINDIQLKEEYIKDKFDNQAFGIHVDGDKIQVSSIHPYDESEYHWAKSMDDGETYIIYINGKMVEMFDDTYGDQASGGFNDIMAELVRLDKEANIKPKKAIW